MAEVHPGEIRENTFPRGKYTRFVIIGAGISGALMGIKLLERGFRNFVILEKAGKMGGTWRDNIYPGVACDVAAHLYSYSFAQNPWWPSRYAEGRHLWAYFHGVARHFGVLPFIRYYKEVASAQDRVPGGGVAFRVHRIFRRQIEPVMCRAQPIA